MTTFSATFSDGTTKTRTSGPGLLYAYAWAAKIVRADGTTVNTTYGFSSDMQAASRASNSGHGWTRQKDGRRVVGEVVATSY